jgi:hypothetical protein
VSGQMSRCFDDGVVSNVHVSSRAARKSHSRCAASSAVNGTGFAAVLSLVPSDVSFSMSVLSRLVLVLLWETGSSPCTARCCRLLRHICLLACAHLITYNQRWRSGTERPSACMSVLMVQAAGVSHAVMQSCTEHESLMK